MNLFKSNPNLSLYFITFFTFIGYNAGLAVFIGANLNTTLYYSIPLKFITSIIMIKYIIKNSKINQGYNDKLKKKITFMFILFTLLYIFKVIFSFGFFMRIVPYKNDWYVYIFYYLSAAILPFFMYSSVDLNDKNKKTIVDALIFSGFILGIVCLFEYGKIIFLGNIGRLGSNPNEGDTLSPLALSYSGSLTIIICLYQMIYKKGLAFAYKFYLIITIFLCILLFLLGSSRGSILALAFCLPIFFIYSKLKGKLKLVLIFILAIPLITYGVMVTGSNIFERVQNSEQNGDIGRSILWNAAKKEFLNHPILGGRIEVSGIYPHEIFLEILMATGIVGILLFLYFFVNSFKRVAFICKRDYSNVFVFLIFLQGVAQYLVTGAIYGAILLFFPIGLIWASYSKNIKNIKS
ncbi:O-antigen ligase family protein [Arachidicoccus soli]|uniref:O-antigen ligase domain-containing protein n=1 Tax=Arachidicoccus soli TaxID=2341117 RepID=A0A386HQ64_9BACT|nr:O-antigen ligase family protein [Arachidicoccus soli]AYD47985.1 O-antigen ligase domain-containing protein [Arachidicoccus soli]